MSQREKTYNHTIRSSKSRLKYRNYKRKHRRERNKLQDVTTLEGVSMAMSSDYETPASQNGNPSGGQVRVSYDEHLPCLPQPHDVESDPFSPYFKAGIANGMQPILQTNTVVQPVPFGTKIRTQNHGGKGGPAQGNLSKMRPVSVEATPDAAFVQSSFTREEGGMSSLF